MKTGGVASWISQEVALPPLFTGSAHFSVVGE